jgi:hypothetical protein
MIDSSQFDQSQTEQVMWRVTKVEDIYLPAGLGGNGRGKRVFFSLPDGTETFIDVPIADFNAPKVAAQIEQHVAAMVDVLTLKGQSF